MPARPRNLQAKEEENSGPVSRPSNAKKGEEEASLKEREYRDAKREVLPHTRTYMDQHGKS